VAAPANIIPFPQSMSPALAPPSSALAAPSEAKLATIPPPPLLHTVHAQALAAKQGQLSLRNYAALGRAVLLPSAAQVPAGVTTAMANKKEKQETTKEKKGGENKNKQEEEADKEEKEKVQPTPAPGMQSAGRVELYWPWGRVAVAALLTPVLPVVVPAAAPPVAAHTNGHAPAHNNDNFSLSSSDNDEEVLRNMEAGRVWNASGSFSAQGEGEETPPMSPLGAGGLLPALELEEMGLSGGKEKGGLEDVPLPELPEWVMSPSPARWGGSASPPVSNGLWVS
jgi:hypothetical protein